MEKSKIQQINNKISLMEVGDFCEDKM